MSTFIVTTRRIVLGVAGAASLFAATSRARAAEKTELDDNQSGAMSWLVQRHLLADGSPAIGGVDADVSIVEFFDYRCPYCKVMAPRIVAMAASDRKLRFIMKEYPILGPQSVVAAKVALVAARHGVYRAFHEAMFALPGPFDRAEVLDVARKAGLDRAAAEREMDSPDILATLRTNLAVGTMLGIKGTPAFVVSGSVIPGAVSTDDLRKIVAAARARG